MLTKATPDLRRLRHFVAVAEAAGFSRASRGLHLSQQALSSSVRQLEREIGAALLVRAGRKVTLTPAGQTLLDEGRVLLAAAHTVVEHTVAAAMTAPEKFVVGHSPAISGRDVYSLLEQTIAQCPATSFTIVQLFPDQLLDGVRAGRVHLGLRRGVAPLERLATAVIRYDALRVAVRRNHPIAERQSIAVGDLAEESIVLWAPPGRSFYSDFLMNTCRHAGFEPTYRVSRVQGCPPETAALTDNAVAFVTSSPGPALDAAVTIVDLDGPVLVPMQGLWQPHTVSAVRDLIIARPKGGTST